MYFYQRGNTYVPYVLQYLVYNSFQPDNESIPDIYPAYLTSQYVILPQHIPRRKVWNMQISFFFGSGENSKKLQGLGGGASAGGAAAGGNSAAGGTSSAGGAAMPAGLNVPGMPDMSALLNAAAAGQQPGK